MLIEDIPNDSHTTQQQIDSDTEWPHNIRQTQFRWEHVDRPSSAELTRQHESDTLETPHTCSEDECQGVYIISVAARLLNMHPQTLRKYERMGLISPPRTLGMLRLYSEEDISKLRLIKHLVDEVKLNLAGVEMALSVTDRLLSMLHQITAIGPNDGNNLTIGLLQQELENILDLINPEN